MTCSKTIRHGSTDNFRPVPTRDLNQKIMRSINKVILIGNLTRDPELRTTPNGQNVVTFSIATNREWVTKDGRRQTMTEFHDLVAWAKLADICAQHLKKSKLVYVEGYLKTRNWTSPENIKKFRTEIVVQDLIMLDKRTSDSEYGEDYIPDDESEQKTNNQENGYEEMEPAHQERKHQPEQRPAPIKKPEEEKEPVSKTAPPKSPEPNLLDIDQDLGL